MPLWMRNYIFHWNFSGHEFSSGSELTFIIGFYSSPSLHHSQSVHEALREVRPPHQAANWSFSTLLYNILPVSDKSTERNLIPYHYLHDICSTFLQALWREYLTSYINFQASRIVQLKQRKQIQENGKGKGWDKRRCDMKKKKKKADKSKIKSPREWKVCSSSLRLI